MIRRAFLMVVAAAALAAAAAVLVVSGAYALYALARDQLHLGPAGAAAGVTLIAALALGIVGLVMALTARKPPANENDLVGRVTALLSEHPMMGAGAALVAGLVALKNPKLATTMLSAFLASRATAKTRRR